MAAGTPCMTYGLAGPPESVNCDAHFTWLKKIPAEARRSSNGCRTASRAEGPPAFLATSTQAEICLRTRMTRRPSCSAGWCAESSCWVRSWRDKASIRPSDRAVPCSTFPIHPSRSATCLSC